MTTATTAVQAPSDHDEDREWAEETPAVEASAKSLRSLLLELDEGDSADVPRRPSSVMLHDPRSSVNERDDATLATRVRTKTTSTNTTTMELRQAEERVRQLEARLLDAEETICHLKAEKMDAWRRVERLSRSMDARNAAEHGSSSADNGVATADASSVDSDDLLAVRYRNQVYALESRLRELQTQHAVEQEERMAVIREQEREVLLLRERLELLQDDADDVRAKYHELLATRRDSYNSSSGRRSRRTSSHVDVQGGGVDGETSVRTSGWRVEDGEDPADSERRNNDEDVLPLPQPPADAAWREELVRHPTPHFDIDSPEVQYLLCAWTRNLKKLQYLRTWLTHVIVATRALPEDFPLGLELPRLSPEIRDGFLTLVVPLLRKQTWREIHVHTRQYNDQFHTDLRIRVVPREP